MHWNYRIVRYRNPKLDSDETFRITEVYYEEGEPWGLVLDSGSPMGESLEELKDDWEGMGKAFDAPVLDYDETMEKITGRPWPYAV